MEDPSDNITQNRCLVSRESLSFKLAYLLAWYSQWCTWGEVCGVQTHPPPNVKCHFQILICFHTKYLIKTSVCAKFHFRMTLSLMVLLHLLLAENERAFFYIFFTATIASNLFDSLVLFEEQKFNITMHNQRRSQWHTWGGGGGGGVGD